MIRFEPTPATRHQSLKFAAEELESHNHDWEHFVMMKHRRPTGVQETGMSQERLLTPGVHNLSERFPGRRLQQVLRLAGTKNPGTTCFGYQKPEVFPPGPSHARAALDGVAAYPGMMRRWLCLLTSDNGRMTPAR